MWEAISKMDDEEQKEAIAHYIHDPLIRNEFLEHLKNTFGEEAKETENRLKEGLKNERSEFRG